ncbi:MAG: YicC/YloC family endoribonuclease [Acutalibacteraceae bacterium]
MRSMTGYGKGQASADGRKVTVEIKTVNHKFFDWSMKMPKGFLFVEDDAKKTVATAVNRGHIDVFVTYEQEAATASEYSVDRALAEKYVAAARELAEATGVEFDVTAYALMKNPDVVSLKVADVDDETLKNLVLTALGEALGNLVAMREKEGASQVVDITEKLDSMQSSLDLIKKYAPEVVSDYRKKLTARITETLGSAVADMSRVATEIALFADKCAIDEEITRLGVHIATMREYLTYTDPVGRKLDFLVQEMNREANTIGSKANDLRITEQVLKLKNDIEKIREQAQNVE